MPNPWEQFQGGVTTEEPPETKKPKGPWDSFADPAPVAQAAPTEPPKPWESFGKETGIAANNPDFDPAAHAAQNPQDFEDAFRIYQARKARPIGEKATEFGSTLTKGETWKEAGKGVLNFLSGFPQVAYNTAQQLKSSAPVTATVLTGGMSNIIPYRDPLTSQAEATITGQQGEEALKHGIDVTAGKLAATGAKMDDPNPERTAFRESYLKRNPAHLTPEQLFERKAQWAQEDQAERELHNEEIDRKVFAQRVQAAKNAIQLSQGQPLDTGAIAGIYKAGGQVPSEEVGPEALKAAGAEQISPERIARMSAASDPNNIALAAAPGLPGGRLIGGGATELAGKGLQLPFKAVEAAHGQAGRIARGTALPVAAVEAAVHPVAGAKVAAGVAGAKGLQVIGKALEAQGKEMRTGLPSELTTQAATAAAKGEGALGTNILRRGGNAVSNAAATAVGIAPINLALAEGDPKRFAELQAGATAFGGTLGGLARNRAALVEGARPFLRSEGARALAEAGEGNDALAQKSAAYIMALPDEARDNTLEAIGALQGLPVDTPSGQKRAKVYVLSEPDYLAEDARASGGQSAMGGGRGFFYGSDGAAYINGDYNLGLGPGDLAHVIGHEFGGHAAINVMLAAGARGGALHQGMVESAKRNLLTRAGKPTPGFQQFIDEYNRRYDPSGKTQRLNPNSPESIDEFIAETAGQIMAGKGAAELALPKNIQDQINDGIGQFLGGLVGIDTRKIGTETHLNRQEIGELTKTVQDTLAQVVGMKLREGREIPEPPKTDTTRIAELQTILRTPRPPAGSPVEQVRQWLTDQRSAAKELSDLQQGPAQVAFPAAGAPPTPPSQPQAPIAPTVNKARVAAILRQQGLSPSEAKAWADQAQGASDADAVLDILKKRAAQKFPTQTPTGQPVATAPSSNEPTPPNTPPPVSPSTTTAVAEPPLPVPATTGSQRSIPALPSRQSVDALVAAAEAKAVAAEKNTTTKAAQQRIREAKVNAIFDAIGDDPQGIHRVVEEDGAVSRVGDFDPENPYHQVLAQLGGGVEGPALQSLLGLQGSKNQTRFIRYRSALSSAGGEGGEGTLETGMDTRRAEYELNPAQNRQESDIQHKVVVPLQTVITKEGLPQVRAFTLDNLLHNAESVREFMRDNPELGPFPYDNEQTLISDAETYANNHAHGWKGDGSAPIQGFPDSNLPKPDLNYKAEQIPKERFDVLNMLLKSQDAGKTPKRELQVDELRQKVSTAKNEREKIRLQGVLERELTRLGRSREAVNLARTNNPWVDPTSGETNELRARMKAAGFDTDVRLKPPIENLEPKHILDISEQPIAQQEGDIPSVRPTGFTTGPESLAPMQRLNPTAVRANFMPREEAKKRIAARPVGQSVDRFEGKAPDVDWDKTDVQVGKWTHKSVSDWLGVPQDKHVYRAMVNINDLNPVRAEHSTAADTRKGEIEIDQSYLNDAEDMLKRWTDTEAQKKPFYDRQFEDWRDHLPWNPADGYDENDVRDLAKEMQARGDESGYDESEFQSKTSGFPPIVVTREKDGTLTLNDGNHRTDIWGQQGFDVAPAWVNDAMARERAPKAMPRDRPETVKMSNAEVTKGPQVQYLPAYHGTPHKVDKFSLEKVGTGEGAQVFGWGLYFAEHPKVAEEYAENVKPDSTAPPRRTLRGTELTPGSPEYHAATLIDTMGKGVAGVRKEVRGWIENAKPGEDVQHYQKVLEILNSITSKRDFGMLEHQGKIYTVDIDAEPEELLDWDKPLNEQSEKVKAELRKRVEIMMQREDPIQRPDARWVANFENGSLTGPQIYKAMEGHDDKTTSERWRDTGIVGIQYLDQGSRVVVFNEPTADGRFRVTSGTAASPSRESKFFQTQKEADDYEAKLKSSGTRNFVIFDDSRIKITHENGEPVTPQERREALGQKQSPREAAQERIKARENP